MMAEKHIPFLALTASSKTFHLAAPVLWPHEGTLKAT